MPVGEMTESEILSVAMDSIDPFAGQSRECFDLPELKALMENIRANGLLQPGVAWYDAGRARYLLLCGERRFRALKEIGQTVMPLKVLRGSLSQGEMLAINLAENLQRASLNPIERGKAFQRFMRLEKLTASEVAARMNVSNATVSNALSLLELPEALQARIVSGELPASVAANIARLCDDETRRLLADQYASGVLNRDGVAAKVHHHLKEGKKPTQGKASRHCFRLGGVAITVTAGKKSLSLDALLPAIRQLLEAAEGLSHRGGKLADLATSLRAS